MNIVDYLQITREPWNIFTADDHPKQLDAIYFLYMDVLEHFDIEVTEPFELVLTQSDSSTQTQIVELNGIHYVVIELQQLCILSEMLEFYAFENIEGAPVSIFERLWFDERYFEMSSADAGIAITFRSESEWTINEDDRDRFTESYLLEHIHKLNGFKVHFQIYVSFIIFHELAHYYYKSFPKEKHEKVLHTLSKLPLDSAPSEYIRDVLADYPIDELDEHDIEEFFCDYIAIQGTWKLCVERRMIDSRIFCFALTTAISSFIAIGMIARIFDSNIYNSIRLRQLRTIAHLLYLERWEHGMKMHEITERFLTLLMLLSNNYALAFSRRLPWVEIEKYRTAARSLLMIRPPDYLDTETHKDSPVAQMNYLKNCVNALSAIWIGDNYEQQQ